MGPGFAATPLLEDAPAKVQRPNPPASNVITDFAAFKGRRITVYYTPAAREVNGLKVKYNDVWRVRINK